MTPRSSRRRKTRYLSLRRRLAAATPVAPMVAAHSSPSLSSDHAQLILFPLHPDTALPDPHDDHLSRFFPNDDAVTLHSLLGPPSAAATDNSSSAAATPLSEDSRSPSSSSANYSACSSSYGNGSAVVGGLARAALRGRERWWAEEEGEAASGSVAADLLASASRRLALKLDYEGILSAWSDKSPLFVEGEALQVVPDVHNTPSGLQYATPVFVDVAGCGSGGAGLWTVPDGRGAGGAVAGKGEEGCAGERAAKEGEEGEEKKDREARVMRYKEKRRHRLFSKRIRYEVRKLNAEKRPRLKGRFVRRDDE